MSAAHRHYPGIDHEHEFEAARGLPEALPSGERLLWQGSPDPRAMARRVFHARKLAAYFAVLLALRAAFLLADGADWAALPGAMAAPAAMSLLALGLVALLARLSAVGAVYTVTDRRVVMRIGIVLTLTFNIPLRRIASAGLALRPDGSGDIAIALTGGDRIGWLHLWPHARPWRVARAEPMLRCLPDAAAVSRLLADAWSQAHPGVAAAAASPRAAAARPAGDAPAVHPVPPMQPMQPAAPAWAAR